MAININVNAQSHKATNLALKNSTTHEYDYQQTLKGFTDTFIQMQQPLEALQDKMVVSNAQAKALYPQILPQYRDILVSRFEKIRKASNGCSTLNSEPVTVANFDKVFREVLIKNIELDVMTLNKPLTVRLTCDSFDAAGNYGGTIFQHAPVTLQPKNYEAGVYSGCGKKFPLYLNGCNNLGDGKFLFSVVNGDAEITQVIETYVPDSSQGGTNPTDTTIDLNGGSKVIKYTTSSGDQINITANLYQTQSQTQTGPSKSGIDSSVVTTTTTTTTAAAPATQIVYVPIPGGSITGLYTQPGMGYTGPYQMLAGSYLNYPYANYGYSGFGATGTLYGQDNFGMWINLGFVSMLDLRGGGLRGNGSVTNYNAITNNYTYNYTNPTTGQTNSQVVYRNHTGTDGGPHEGTGTGSTTATRNPYSDGGIPGTSGTTGPNTNVHTTAPNTNTNANSNSNSGTPTGPNSNVKSLSAGKSGGRNTQAVNSPKAPIKPEATPVNKPLQASKQPIFDRKQNNQNMRQLQQDLARQGSVVHQQANQASNTPAPQQARALQNAQLAQAPQQANRLVNAPQANTNSNHSSLNNNQHPVQANQSAQNQNSFSKPSNSARPFTARTNTMPANQAPRTAAQQQPVANYRPAQPALNNFSRPATFSQASFNNRPMQNAYTGGGRRFGR